MQDEHAMLLWHSPPELDVPSPSSMLFLLFPVLLYADQLCQCCAPMLLEGVHLSKVFHPFFSFSSFAPSRFCFLPMLRKYAGSCLWARRGFALPSNSCFCCCCCLPPAAARAPPTVSWLLLQLLRPPTPAAQSCDWRLPCHKILYKLSKTIVDIYRLSKILAKTLIRLDKRRSAVMGVSKMQMVTVMVYLAVDLSLATVFATANPLARSQCATRQASFFFGTKIPLACFNSISTWSKTADVRLLIRATSY